MTVFRSVSPIFLVFFALSPIALSQEGRFQSTVNSCREFVNEFYSWYAATAPKEKQEFAGDVALSHRSNLFSPAIVRGIQEEEMYQRMAGSDLVSLDSDPFVGGDGVADGYLVKKVTVRNNRCWAEVHALWNGMEHEPADVLPELVMRNGRWLFVDFYFPTLSNPKGWSLLDALKQLRKEYKEYLRYKPRKAPYR